VLERGYHMSLLLRQLAHRARTPLPLPLLRTRDRVTAPPFLAAARGLAQRIPPHKVYPQWSAPPPLHEHAMPHEWLGAYYKLSAVDPKLMPEQKAAMLRNKAKLKGKRAPARGRYIVGVLEAVQRTKLEAVDPWRKPYYFEPGDFLEVEYCSKIDEPPDRVTGMMIGVHQRGLGSSFRLLCQVDNTPLEYHFQLYSPLLQKVTLRQKSSWRDMKRKLYVMRKKVSSITFPKVTPRGKEPGPPTPPARKKKGDGARPKER